MPEPNHQSQPTTHPTGAPRNFSHLESGFFDDSKTAKTPSEHTSESNKKPPESPAFTASISSSNQRVKNNFIPATIILAIVTLASLICSGVLLAQNLSKANTINVLESQKADLENRIIELQHPSNSSSSAE